MRNRRPKKKKKGIDKTVTLPITELGAGGDGIGSYDDKPVYVPKTLPGDHVTVNIDKASAGGFMARLLSFETPSEQRATPSCQHFDQCGGCDLQHMTQEAYREWKVAKVKKTLERADVQPKIWEEPIFMEAASRRRTTLAVLKMGKKLRLGYHEPRSHNIVSVQDCPILEPALNAKIQDLRPFLLRLAPERKAVSITLQMTGGLDVVLIGEDWRERGMFSLEQNETLAEMAHALDIARLSIRDNDLSEPEVLIMRCSIIKKFGAISVTLPPVPFLQASDAGESALVKCVAEHAKGGKNIIDLFCGCGTFTGALLKNGAQVHAIDSDENAVSALAKTNYLNLTTHVGNLFKEPLISRDLNDYDMAVFDPPRAGAKAQVEELAYSDIPRIIAVSCNPSTFARDANILIEEGDYALGSVRIIDQFVWSAHVEIVGLFVRD